jgi:hypothetical protein
MSKETVMPIWQLAQNLNAGTEERQTVRFLTNFSVPPGTLQDMQCEEP